MPAGACPPPKTHGAHVAAPEPDQLPTVHSTHLLLPSVEYEPAGQLVHVPALRGSKYLPAGQLTVPEMVMPSPSRTTPLTPVPTALWPKARQIESVGLVTPGRVNVRIAGAVVMA